MYRASVFDIPRKPQHLRSENEGTANAHYRQITATKDVTGQSFFQGAQQFRFETSGNTWFIPSMSYFRFRCQLLQTRRANERPHPVLSGQDIAPNMGLAANLFKSVEVRLNGHTLERITERLPQIDALKTRMRNTGSWLDQVGKTTNFWEPDFYKRREQVCVDGYLPSPSSEPVYGPWLTQVEAGFDIQHRLRYDRNTQVVEFDGADNVNHVLNIQHGPNALRMGDRLRHGELVLKILQIQDPTHALVECVRAGPNGNVDVQEDVEAKEEEEEEEEEDEEDEVRRGARGWFVQKLSSANNNTARGQSDFEIIWRPPLGFFDVEHAIPPGGEWMIEFNPENALDASKNVVESLLEDLPLALIGGQPNSFNFAVGEFFFYAYTLESDRFDHGDWFLDLQHTRCQLQNIPNNAMSLTQKTFDVPGKTSALTLAFQDQGPTSDTRYSQSKFKIRPAPHDRERSSTVEGQDLMLERFFIQYGNEQKPVPDFDGMYTKSLADSTQRTNNHLVHRYVDSLMQANLFHTDGGAESFDDWIRRGPYYHFRWPKDAMETSTRVTVNFKFGAAFAEGLEHQVMLFSQWRTAYKITHRNGRIHLPTLQEL